jgi:hypothetical protein
MTGKHRAVKKPRIDSDAIQGLFFILGSGIVVAGLIVAVALSVYLVGYGGWH